MVRREHFQNYTITGINNTWLLLGGGWGGGIAEDGNEALHRNKGEGEKRT